ncbi:MAG TPA: hypothetical protein VEI97_12555, partial [bacterium]|nr:hypothetical protein [bacterium]
MRSNQVPLIMLGLLLVLVVGLAAQLTWDASRGSSASVAAVVPSPNHTAPRPQPSSKSQWDELAELQALEGFAPLMAAHACWIAAMRDRPVFTENPSQALESASPLLWVWPTDGTGTPLPLARNDTGPGFLLRNGEYAMQFDLERSQMG